MKLTNVRASFVNVFEPKRFDAKSEPRFEFTALLCKETQQDQIKMVEEAMEKAKLAKWPKGKKRLTGVCFEDGDDLGYDGYEGHMALKMARRAADGRPLIVNRRCETITDPADPQAPYSGCYCNVECDVYATDNHSANRINGSIKGIQFKRDGDRLSGAAAAKLSDFSPEEEEEEEEDDMLT